MNTKEAIRWLNANKYLTRYKEVIELLQRGEKYREKREKFYDTNTQIRIYDTLMNFQDLLIKHEKVKGEATKIIKQIEKVRELLEQKYFPKEK